MKLIASFVSLTLVAVLSAWLYLGQGDTDVETAGVQIGASGSTDGNQSGPTHPGDPVTSDTPLFSDDYAAAFVGLQAVLDVWHAQPGEALADPDAFNALFAEARENAVTEIAAIETKAKEEAAAKEAAAEKKAQEEAAAHKKAQEEAAAEKARQEAAQPPKAVSPPPVSPAPPPPPPYDDDDDDDDDDNDDDDDDDDDDDWDDD